MPSYRNIIIRLEFSETVTRKSFIFFNLSQQKRQCSPSGESAPIGKASNDSGEETPGKEKGERNNVLALATDRVDPCPSHEPFPSFPPAVPLGGRRPVSLARS
jgi:hypothetical protein